MIRASMAVAFGPLKGSEGVVEVQGVRPIGDGVAIVNRTSCAVLPGEAEPAAEQWARDILTLSTRNGSGLSTLTTALR